MARSGDLLSLVARLKKVKKNIAFVQTKSLTQVAWSAQKDLTKAMLVSFDRPTPYTLRGVRVLPATKDRSFAEVYLDEFAGKGTPPAEYLLAQITGGTRRPKRSEVLLARLFGSGYMIPANWVRDSYGNIKKGMIQKILAQVGANYDPTSNQTLVSKGRKRRTAHPQAEFFAVTQRSGKLKLGIYARYRFGHGSAIRPVLIFVSKVHYQVRYPFKQIARKSVADNWRTIFKANFEAYAKEGF